MIDRLGWDNLAVDFLSRMNISQDRALAPIPNDSLDDNFFSISTFTPWFSNIANYFLSGKLTENPSTRENRNII